ncbi:MAG: M48 family metallopeptidase [Candidatus Peribacteria bacterium]|jgi:predicted metal-dependent hydrolase|nr:M48 family metallopeptidase [Candidatus Peribacteria bacterium]
MLPSEVIYPYTITYTYNRNAYIRISNEGTVLFRIPQRCKSNQQLLHQLFQKADLLRKRHQTHSKIEKRNEEGLFLFGEWILREDFLGEGVNKPSQVVLEKQLKTILYEYAKERLELFSQQLGVSYHSLTIRKAKSKRGSCSHHQHIMLNLALVYLPRSYIQYVIAHEVAHLIEKNHSSAFRALVQQLFPSYKETRKKLKKLVIL